jgi:hypothetical protein
LIVKTRWGGLNAGADLFALTWLDISNFAGLDIVSRNYHKGAWTFMDKLELAPKRGACSEIENGSVPKLRTAQVLPVPKSGTEKAISTANAVPKFGNNECLPLGTGQSPKRVVGRKGRSGIRRVA